MPVPTQEQQDLFQLICNHAGFAPSLADNVRIYEVDEIPPEDERGWRQIDGWKVSFEGTVGDDWTNPLGNMHGAAYAWVLDSCTSAALVATHTPTFWGLPMLSGISLNMELQYLNPAPKGTKLLIDVEIVKCTSKLANLRCDVKDMKTGKIYATGTQIKYWKAMATAKL
ncbi:hypothetical protein CI109_103811 [Kwoniella shandongensis]|uniref:Uncharacterized protein n=1 Tax=Kwoniella shandongensis TaxID=1734106 RepID=A0A5M6C728_9TREE|nr:uncharacterized protein CI109_000495 [Kwoniella shandongensis]KAA5530924.1 hypothetical protein CI109_000495 [Kwoniella shandongensis]